MNQQLANQPRLKLPHSVIVRAPGLLPMYYRIPELATDLGISARRLRGWLRFGAPNQVDERGRIWINGQEFKQWVLAQKKVRRLRLAKDEAHCMRCARPVQLLNPRRVPIQGKLYHLKGQCPFCGSPVNRGSCYD